VEDALLFHEPRHEVEVCLAILYAECPLRIRPRETQLVVGMSEPLEHLLQDLGYGELLVYAGLARELEEPQPGHDLGPVDHEVIVPHALAEAAAYAVEQPLLAALHAQRHEHGL